MHLTPEQFIGKWKDNDLSERSGAQAHFEDLCSLLGVEPPRKSGEYCYEQDLKKIHGGIGFADVWKRGCFAWENKGPDKDLRGALMQLKGYASALDNPPVLVVCNRERIEIHPCFTGYPSTPRIIPLLDIGRPENLQALRWLFSKEDVYKLRPLKSNAAITADAAADFAVVAKSMRDRGLDSQQVAHFLIQCIFCMYAEDEGLLHRGTTENQQIFTSILRSAKDDVERARSRIESLFKAMQKPEGQYGNDDIAWFNGGLFKVIDIPPLTAQDLSILRSAAENLDWRAIDPTIFGTLFERGLDPSARAPLGAHYTDTSTIGKLISPLIVEPLAAEWAIIKEQLIAAKDKGRKTPAYKAAIAAYQGYLARLRDFRVLDPACGSGNFLYLAMHALKDLEHTAQLDAELLGYGRQNLIETGPANVLGIEINEYAAELARVTVWIGDIQWCQRNGQRIAENPILRSLEGIEHRDALMTPEGEEAVWPTADVIVGNPPFLGTKKQWSELGRDYTDRLRKLYEGRVPGFADLVLYWFEKARAQLLAGQALRAGFVATNSIRGGANRTVLDRICESTSIFNAWSDEEWINDGANVRVSMVCFGDDPRTPMLNGSVVEKINPDLSTGSAITTAAKLSENSGCAFVATVKGGSFDIPGETARSWLRLPNPHGKPNSDVLKPWANGMDVTRRSSDTWIIDFGVDMPEEDAMLYEKPFSYVKEHVLGQRQAKEMDTKYKRRWLMARPIPAMRKALEGLDRYIATPVVAKHRLFVWMDVRVLADHQLVVMARGDDTTFGILHSRFHELWALKLGTALEDRPRYTPSTTFETFPFPQGLTPANTVGCPVAHGDLCLPPVGNDFVPNARKIATAAKTLNDRRNQWLNPAEWIERVPEELPNYPDRILARKGHEADLKKRTLTNLYNEMPPWLRSAHVAIDTAVAAAYGWNDYHPEMSDEEVLARLLALNIARTRNPPGQ